MIERAKAIYDCWYHSKLTQTVSVVAAAASAVVGAAAVHAEAGPNSSRTTSASRGPIPSQYRHRLRRVGTRTIVPHGSSSMWTTTSRRRRRRRRAFRPVADIAWEEWPISPRHVVAAAFVVFGIEAADVEYSPEVVRRRRRRHWNRRRFCPQTSSSSSARHPYAAT